MKAKNKLIRNDIILILCLLIVAAIGILYLFVFRNQGNTVKVTVDGEIYGIYSLSENVTEDIYTGENHQHHNRLIIKNAKAYMATASCPDGICVTHAPIFRDGESIVCLPNRVVITVVSDDDTASPDIVA